MKMTTNKTSKQQNQNKTFFNEHVTEKVIIGEPNSFYPSILKKSTFSNATSPSFELKSNLKNDSTNLQYSPSFNLKSNQKSTPSQNKRSNASETKVEIHTQANDSDIILDTSFQSCV